MHLGLGMLDGYRFKIFAVKNLPSGLKGNPRTSLGAVGMAAPRNPDATNLHKQVFTLADDLYVALLKQRFIHLCSPKYERSEKAFNTT
jgi:hypothetical protein